MSAWGDFKGMFYMFVWGTIFTIPLVFLSLWIGNETPAKDIIGSILAFLTVFTALPAIMGFMLMVVLVIMEAVKYIFNKIDGWLE